MRSVGTDRYLHRSGANLAHFEKRAEGRRQACVFDIPAGI